ncbi:iron-siderophore ABC transporter substrate-binding protein [Paenibacillus sp. IB182496]|uniref:Iron-siderophore ABC transporter substrate-binding protein n=1 Tax=Paenibacillus sabuli TaxID=2772509 RepID=A0A927GRH4_9BACL|nr:iron-siderophore ABC transporter substrate-binding protein [Paenibacillus sabuli]MBD2845493.1 iron-siderophore ABC transporter substrate-binding protein [Paenibacillus sabuli]
MRRMKWSGMLLVAVLLAVVVIAGCGEGGNAEETDAEAQDAAQAQTEDSGAAQSNAAEPAEEKAQSRTIVHAMGETTVTGTPERVVSLYQGANDVAVAFGITPVGIVESWSPEEPVYAYLQDALGDVPLLGAEHQPNLEEVHKLKPDVILATKLRHEKIYDQLSAIAPTVMIDQVYDWKDTVRLMGEALGQQDKADELMQAWDTRVADFKTQMEGQLPIEATITNFRADHARIFYSGYAGGILKELGFTRPPGHDSEEWGVQLTSKESIQDMNADVIFNFNSPDETGAVDQLYEEWTAHPLWQNLDAVKNGHVVQVDGTAWNFAGGYLSAHIMLDELYAHFGLDQ